MARRVNTRFLLILLMIIVGAGAALEIAQKLLIHEHPEKYINAGTEAARQQKWVEAADAFAKASSLDPRNTDLLMKLGGALHYVAKSDPDRVWQEQSAYVRALDIDPNFFPAVKALVTWYQAAVAGNPDANLYRDLIRYANRARELKPDDSDLAALPDELVVQETMAGLTTDQQKVDEAVTHLTALQKKYPNEAKIPFVLAEAKIQQGEDLARQIATPDQPAQTTAAYGQAAKIFQDLLETPKPGPQDENASMHYRYAQVLEFLASVDQSSVEARGKYLDKAWAQIQRARALAKEKETDYLPINQYAAEMAEQRGDHKMAVKIYRSVPDSIEVRLALANLLGRSTESRPEGEQLVESSLATAGGDPDHPVGVRYALMGLLTDMQISDYEETRDPAAKKALADKIQPALDRMTAASGSKIPLDLRRRKARFGLLTGHAIDVIQELSKQRADDPAMAKDFISMTLLAEGYRQTSQFSEAIKILQDLVGRFPHEIQTRKDLTKLLILESPDKAAAQMDELERETPNDPELVLMRLQMLSNPSDREQNKPEIKQYFGRLREDNDQQISLKIRAAIQLQDWDDAVRLLDNRIKTSTDPQTFVQLARVQMYLGKKDQALATAARGLALNPDSGVLKVLIPSIKGDDPKLVENMQEDLARQNPDHVQGELTLASLARERNDIEAEEAHLKAADKLSPKTPRIWRELFMYYLRTNRPDNAAAYVDELAAVNSDGADGELDRFQLAMVRGDTAGALEIAQRLTQKSPEFAATWVALGQVLQARGQFAQAVDQYVISLQKQAANRDAYLGLIRCQYQLDRPDNALQYINEAINKLPNDQAFREMLITHQINYGNPSDAIKVLQDEISRTAGTPDLYAALGITCIRAAKTLESNHNHAEATKNLKYAIDVLTQSLAKWPDEESLNVALADAQVTAGQVQQAQQTLLKWASSPEWRMRPNPHVRLAQFYEDYGQPAAAESELRTALARSNYRVDLQIAMADLLAKHNKFDDSLSLLRGVNSDKLQIKEAIIRILFKSGKFDDAIDQIKSDLDQHPPDSSKLLTIWAEALMDRRQYSDAADRATEALKLDPSNTEAVYCRGRSRLRLTPPDSSGGLADLTAVRQASPSDLQVRVDLASAYLEVGRLDDAATELKAGLRANPYNKAVRMMLVDIYTNGPHPYLPDALRLLKEIDAAPPFDTDPQIFNREATVLLQMGNMDDALAASQKAMGIAPNDPSVVATELTVLLRSKRYADVVNTINSLPGGFKDSSWALVDRAMAEKLADPNSVETVAQTDMRAALAAAIREKSDETFHGIAQTMAQELGYDPAIAAVTPYAKDHLIARISLAELLLMQGKYSQAVAKADEISAGFDQLDRANQVAVARTAARVYQAARPMPPAQKCYDALQRWLKLEPNSIDALNNLACLLADDYSPPRAAEGLQYVQKAVDEMANFGQSNPNLLDTQGWLLILSGAPEQGVSVLNKVVESKPFPEAYLHLGEGYLRMQLAPQAADQAKLGLALLAQRPAGTQDSELKAKLQDLSARSQVLMKPKQ